MTQYAITYDNALVLINKENEHIQLERKLEGMNTISVAQDPHARDTLYCGTFDRGLWKSVDKGQTWFPIGTRFTYNSPFNKDDIHMIAVTAVTVIDTGDNRSAVLVGTEPSALFISYNQGDSFELLTDFSHITGKDHWFFPPRPHTHHVKWFDTNIKSPNMINLTIEAGGFIQSTDAGQHWEAPKTQDTPIDIHVLKSHLEYPNKMYGVLGDAFLNGGRDTFIESDDYGKTWTTFIDGIEHRYGYGLAVHSLNPNNIVIATSDSPFDAHNYGNNTFSTIYYIDKKQESKWTEATKGLPSPDGTLVSAVTERDGIFYLANNKGVYYSDDGGIHWVAFDIAWPDSLTSQHAHQFITLN
ncbi:WD40/YVTN/BNR-like repeat-containing protein [Staphylococcus nepalensis]|uniref:WD40/YVTN/BNR-like repeat-containing protein n=1 Tax=Staphylococcus nepalensis TaxID=214473 RepID=UPI001A999E0E|nr:hypothetical protein [Staphylococcus nepalensis]MBO1221903.1 hypothetical protein [Staphylococcus nepalensis]